MKSASDGHDRVVLAIDVGNTRLKWGLHNGSGWTRLAWVSTTNAAELKSEFAALSADVIVASNVADDGIAAQLTAMLPKPPQWIHSRREQCGVHNSYAIPTQLGSDRWAALIAARASSVGPVVVVNAGTALTCDALNADGVFLGGIIVPGADLMLNALAGNTAALKRQAGSYSTFPTDTGSAIMSGVIDALCGAIERMAGYLKQSAGTEPSCVLSGGGAALFMPHINLKTKVVDNLVLEGLIVIAGEHRR